MKQLISVLFSEARSKELVTGIGAYATGKHMVRLTGLCMDQRLAGTHAQAGDAKAQVIANNYYYNIHK
jgi:hypothetical protein